jgi:hypothetical protein
VTAVAARLYRGDDDNFEFGLDLILDALEARAGQRAAPDATRPSTG